METSAPLKLALDAISFSIFELEQCSENKISFSVERKLDNPVTKMIKRESKYRL